MADKDQGSFIGGFTLGMFAGALGYFLFATDKGKKIKSQIVKEWSAARASLPDQEDGLASFNSLRDLLTHIKQQIDTSTAEAEQKLQKQPRKKTSTKRASKFKGV